MATENQQPQQAEVLYVSAPGKVILHGEHAVVYGKTALATSLNLRTFLRLTSTNDNTVSLHLPNIGLNQTWNLDILKEKFPSLLGKDVNDCKPACDELVEQLKLIDGYREEDGTKGMALIAFAYLYLSIMGSGRLHGCKVLVVSQLPTGAGLGSSAAFSVCLAASFLKSVAAVASGDQAECDQKDLTKSDLDLINKWAFEGERLIHGNPSGIDNSVSVYGGALEFRNKPFISITLLDKMPQLHILLINTKVPRSTKELVAGVRRKLDKYPTIINPVLDSIDHLALTCKTILLGTTSSSPSEDQMVQLEELIDMNHSFLSILGVSHPSLQQICLATSQYGLHSKLTGAGGGGCAFVLLWPDTPAHSVEAICEKMKEFGFESWETCLGGVGVVCHGDREMLVKSGFNVPERIWKSP